MAFHSHAYVGDYNFYFERGFLNWLFTENEDNMEKIYAHHQWSTL